MRALLALTLPLLLACDRAPAPADARDVTLAPTPPAAPGLLAPSNRDRAEEPWSQRWSICVTPGRAALRGVFGEEVEFGPPGYGETPAEDARDTIPVLRLPAPLALCLDSLDRGAHTDTVTDRRVALRGVPAAIRRWKGRPVTVYGRLGRSDFGFEHGPIVLWVDSVPALRGPVPARSAALVSPNAIREFWRKG